MGVAYETIQAADLTVTVWDGDVSADDWRQQVGALIESGDVRCTRRFLTDVSAAKNVATIGDPEIVAAAERFVLATPIGAKVAIVAPRLFEGAQVFQRESLTAGVRTIVFNDVVTACSWLGVKVDDARDAVTKLRRRIRTDARQQSG